MYVVFIFFFVYNEVYVWLFVNLLLYVFESVGGEWGKGKFSVFFV